MHDIESSLKSVIFSPNKEWKVFNFHLKEMKKLVWNIKSSSFLLSSFSLDDLDDFFPPTTEKGCKPSLQKWQQAERAH